MVKILKCYNFKSSTILKNVKSEPIRLSSGLNYLVLATHDCSIEVFRHDKNDWQVYCQFQTGAQVSLVEYNTAGDYIATIERKSSRLSDVVSVKVYLNWHIAHTSKDYRTRVRVAGLGYRSSNVDTGVRLEVVDVPCEKSTSCFTTCQQTGNLGLVSTNQVRLYHLIEKTIPNSQTTYLDVILFLELKFDLNITHLSICEDFMACSTNDYVQVLQVSISNEAELRTFASKENLQDVMKQNRRVSSVMSSLTLKENVSSVPSVDFHVKPKPSITGQPKFSLVGDRSSTPSPASKLSSKGIVHSTIEDDTDFVQWKFTSTPLMSLSSSFVNHMDLSSTHDNDSLYLKGLVNLGKKEKPEPEPNLPLLTDMRGGGHHSTGLTTVSKLLYQYLDQSDISWIHLQLVPTYLCGKDDRLLLTRTGSPVHSSRRNSLVGMSCFMSGSRAGYMYSLIPKPTLLSMYKYSSDALQMTTNGRMVFVMVMNSLEIYTCRCQMAVIHNLEKFDNILMACPPHTLEVCMCGVQRFLGPKEMTVSGDHIILFNKIDTAWNINVLEESSATELYKDMVRFGDKYRNTAPHVYHHLLLEGHMTLKSSVISQSLDQSELLVVQEKLSESAALLGEFYSLPGCLDWQLCVPYYNMSGQGFIDVVRQAVQHRQHSKQDDMYGPGFVQYLKYNLFLDEDPLTLQQADADLILEVCYEAIPEKFADIVLFSRLRNFSPEKTLQIFHKNTKHQEVIDAKSRIKENLALVSLNLQLCEPDVAVASLLAIDKDDLIEACVEDHQILHSGLAEFSPIAQLLRCNCSDLLIHILVLLHDKGTIFMDVALRLLQGTSDVLEIHKNTHVMAYLEALVNDGSRKFSFDEAVPKLCEIYMRRLLQWEPPSIREVSPSMKFRLPVGTGHFARRHVWLDSLPPFSGARSITKTCKYLVPVDVKRTGKQPHQFLQCQRSEETCSCLQCNEDLLKLQSLLCYKDCSFLTCDNILVLLNDFPNMKCFDSVRILCQIHVDIDSAITTIATRHSDIAAEFGTSIFKDNHIQWDSMLKCILLQIKDVGVSDSKDLNNDLHLRVVKDVLREMALALKPNTFLNILPGDGNFFFFLPCIRMCINSFKSAMLKDKFEMIGNQLSVKHTA